MSADGKEWLARIEAKLDQVLARLPRERPQVDLDGPKGDPVVRRNPKKWDGPSYEGAPYSKCPSAFLRILASSLEYKADMTEKDGDPERQKFVKYDRLDAARALGWAQRNEGKTMPPPGGEPDVSFPPPGDTEDAW